MVSVQSRREQVRFAARHGVSQRRACTLFQTSRSSLSYQHRMPVKEAEIITAMKELSGQYPRFGSRRIRIMLQRQRMELGKERCSRIWAKAQLQVPKKRRRKIRNAKRQPMHATQQKRCMEL